MANKKYIVGGKVYEATSERKVIVGGKVLQEAIAAAGGTTPKGPLTKIFTGPFEGPLQ